MKNVVESGWQESLLRLDDSDFLTIMRLYLGEVKTPYNKQRLIGSLEGFLRREEVQKNIVTQLSKLDVKILSAIKFIPGANLRKLGDLFEGSGIQDILTECLVSYKKRLLIYTYTRASEKNPEYKINPILDGALEKALSVKSLVPDAKQKPPLDGADCVSADLVGAYIAFIARTPGICKINGEFKKKAQADLEEKFPGQLERLRLLTRAFLNLGILFEEESGFRVNWKKIDSLSKIENDELLIYLLVSISMHFNRRKTKAFAELFWATINAIPETGFTRKSLWRYADLLALRRGDGAESSGLGQSRFARIIQAHRESENFFDLSESGNSLNVYINAMVEDAVTLGILLQGEDGTVFKNPKFFEKKNTLVQLHIDSAFNITLMPGLPFDRIAELIRFMDLVKFDTASTFEINQNSANRAFDEGMSGAQIVSILKDNSGFEVPEPLVISLEEWEASYKSVFVYKGFVVKFDQKSAEIWGNNPLLEKHILVRLAPQVVLLDLNDESEVKLLLKECGIENAGKIRSTGHTPDATTFLPLEKTAPLFAKTSTDASEGADRNENAENHLQGLYKKIEALDLPVPEKDLLRNIASLKIIVSESQLKKPALPAEKNSAEGMDYDGKLYVIERAIDEGQDILFRLSKKSKLLRGFPFSIDKTTYEDGVYVNVFVENTQKEFSIGRIEFVQRVSRIV